MSLLLLQDIVFSWPKQLQPTVQLQRLEVAPQERIFLRGPSGSGKTTLLSLMAGIATPQHGSVSFQNQDIVPWSGSQRDRWRADQLGIVFQLFNLLPYLSVLDNVLLSARFSTARRQRAEQSGGSARQEATRLLSRLGLQEALWSRPATTLSVGQQQRVAVARALLGRPALVLADEPTSALDGDHRDQFIQLLIEEADAAGSALLFVSHDMALAKHFSRAIDLSDINHAQRQGTF
ncbi:MAG: methionine ABC transporter ATP-binding protein [Gammaproteobacteria bacterium HGW-Gammaproteobacteria-14]|nr:MAG: methionine ABC transporter ATP-binding protein [Gammaproteobacteria bacterium HGW-Gammaproteobacteria-14]